MKLYIILLTISFFQLNLGFSTEDNASEYYSELERFNRGFFTQVLSDPFGLQSEFKTSDKLDSIRDFKNILKNFPNEPGINEFDASGMAPLHYLAITRIESNEDYDSIKEMCNILISIGADINLPNKFGVSPLSLAVNYGNYSIVDAFLTTGKLRKDFRVFDIIFSDILDSEWQIYRTNFLYGRIQICNSLQKAWLKNIISSDLEIIQIKFNEVTTQLYESIESGYITLENNQIIKDSLIKIQNIFKRSIDNLRTSKNSFAIWHSLQNFDINYS